METRLEKHSKLLKIMYSQLISNMSKTIYRNTNIVGTGEYDHQYNCLVVWV